MGKTQTMVTGCRGLWLHDGPVFLVWTCAWLVIVHHSLKQLWFAGTQGSCLVQWLAGVSLSEPHIDEFAVEYIHIYCMLCCKSLLFPTCTCILRVLASFINYKLLSEKTRTTYLLDGNSKDGDHLWTYLLFDDQSNRGHRMAKRFHLSMPLFALPLTVEVTHHMDRPLISMATSMRAIAFHKRWRECHFSVDRSCKARGVLDLRACSNHIDWVWHAC